MIDPPDCVIPAAGLATRMAGSVGGSGGHADGDAERTKPLQPLRDKPLIRHAVDNALAVCPRCIVVTGYQHSEVEAILQGIIGVELVYHRDFEQGMLSSIRAGARMVKTGWFFIAPADMPLLAPDIYRTVLDAACAESGSVFHGGTLPHHRPDSDVVAFFPRFHGRRGHPVLVNRAVLAQLERLVLPRDCSGMRTFLDSVNGITKNVALSDSRIHRDVDTSEDLAAICRDLR